MKNEIIRLQNLIADIDKGVSPWGKYTELEKAGVVFGVNLSINELRKVQLQQIFEAAKGGKVDL